MSLLTDLGRSKTVNGFAIRILPGRLLLNKTEVADIIDLSSSVYTQSSLLSRNRAIQLAFRAGMEAGKAAR